MDGFLTIGITLPELVDASRLLDTPAGQCTETEAIIRMLGGGGFDWFHIRKPHAPARAVAKLIEGIPDELHRRLRLHDHFELTEEFDLGGVHLNRRNPSLPQYARSWSASLHSLQELALIPECVFGCMQDERSVAKHAYVTLSPVFDSISKKDYSAGFASDLYSLKPLLVGKRVVALGGVTPDSRTALMEAGFYGMAMLGCLWGGRAH